MLPPTQLIIRLAPGHVRRLADRPTLDQIVGGPSLLLAWLEVQLGLPHAEMHRAARVMQFATALDSVSDACFTRSMQADRWATASELLERRDGLMLCGWDGKPNDTHPRIARDLARAEAVHTDGFPGIAERIAAVGEALHAGQILPSHQCQLEEPLEYWPKAWQAILTKLNVCQPDVSVPLSPNSSALFKAACVVRGQKPSSISCDASLRVTQTRSDTAAVEFVAAVLANSPEKLSTTVVYCEDDALAVRLDACLQRIGLPTMGASLQTRAHPVLQVLPLSLELCWDPVDPQCLLDFLTLPVLPLPRPAASSLARALSEQPGLGSEAWESAFAELCKTSEADDGKLKDCLLEWLGGQRSPHGEPIASELISDQCKRVAKWAVGRATVIWQNDSLTPTDEQIAIVLHEASRQASLLASLVELVGDLIAQPQLGRLLEEVMDRGAESKPCLEAEGGPVRVRSLSEIADPYDRLIWLGTGTADTPACRWSVKQIREFANAGIIIDDGTHRLRSLRAAEARGFCLVRESMLTVLLPQNAERRSHPFWLAIEQQLPKDPKPVAVEDLIERDEGQGLWPFVFNCQAVRVVSSQPMRALWEIPARLLRDREYVSASELQDRLACPLKWTLQYQAGLRSSEIASLPDDYQLRGNLFHKIIERVFGNEGDLPSVEQAVAQVEETFDKRLPLDAAPLAQPDKRVESHRLRNELSKATRVFVTALRSGGYQSVKIEWPLDGSAFGKQLKGWIDCVATRADGREAVVDFKYGGRNKYYDMIKDGESLQLATYALSRRSETGHFPAVAYLILSDGMLFTPSGSPLEGVASAEVIDGPSIESVWNNFSAAIIAADDWLTTDKPVPARPLQDASDWPGGTELVLKEKLPKGDTQSVCRYCDYTRLCGIEVIQ